MKTIFDLMDKNINILRDLLPKYTCPYCDYHFLDESEAESAVDEGCPSCRKIIDWSDYID